MKKNILLLVGPIQTGKSSALQRLFSHREDVRGFITPDGENGREVHILPRGSEPIIPMQAENPSGKTLSIGRYHFYTSAFEAMKSELKQLQRNPAKWNVVDELGKLELKGEGLSPEIDKLIFTWKSRSIDDKLILVIRDELIKKASQTHGLQDFPEISLEDLEEILKT